MRATARQKRGAVPKAFGSRRGAPTLPICAASNKQSGGITGKILSTRLDGTSDITIKPPTLQQSSQKVPGEISRNAVPILHRRDARSKIAIAISRMLHGANL